MTTARQRACHFDRLCVEGQKFGKDSYTLVALLIFVVALLISVVALLISSTGRTCCDAFKVCIPDASRADAHLQQVDSSDNDPDDNDVDVNDYADTHLVSFVKSC